MVPASQMVEVHSRCGLIGIPVQNRRQHLRQMPKDRLRVIEGRREVGTAEREHSRRDESAEQFVVGGMGNLPMGHQIEIQGNFHCAGTIRRGNQFLGEVGQHASVLGGVTARG